MFFRAATSTAGAAKRTRTEYTVFYFTSRAVICHGIKKIDHVYL